jgi:hypothetical protein
MSTVEGGSNIVTNGLVLYLDAANNRSYSDGVNFFDLSRYGNSGTLLGPTLSNDKGGSILFDGVDDYIDNIGYTSSFDFIFSTGNFSISFWLKISTLNSRMIFIGNTGTNEEKGFLISVEYGVSGFGNNCMRMAVSGNSINTRLIAGSTDDSTTSTDWTYWTFVGTNGDYVGQWYKNGYSINTTTRVGSGNANQGSYYSGPSTRTLNIGRTNFTSTILSFSGNISSVKIYNRPLSSSEVLQNFNAAKSRFGL